MKIRFAKKEDIPAVNDIYNQSIPAKKSTAHLFPVSIQERTAWFKRHKPEQYPVFVAEKDGKLIGWISLSPYRSGRQALRYTAEVSYYIHQKFHRQGVATLLMNHVIQNCSKFTIKTLIAILMAHNTGSIQLLKKFNFEEWGRLPGILDIDGKEYDHLYFGLKVGD